MIEGRFAKVGIAGLLLGGVWAVGLGVEKLGGERLVNQSAGEGVLVPEIATEIAPITKPIKHSAMVALSIPKVTAIDPGSVKVTTPGLTLDNAQIHPIFEYKKSENPKPRSILVLFDNSRSMTDANGGNPASDPNYSRLDACRLLLDSLSPTADKVSLACFPCRHSVSDQMKPGMWRSTRPFELFAKSVTPFEAADQLDSLRKEENGPTPLYRAVQQGAQALVNTPKGVRRILVILTDGRDSDQEPEGLDRATQAIAKSGVETYAIGLGPSADIDVLKEMTPYVMKADDATALDRAFRQILLQMSREVVQIDLDVSVSRLGKPIASGQPIDVTFRVGGKLYHSKGKAQ